MKEIELVNDKLYSKQMNELFEYNFNEIPFFIFPLFEFNILQNFDNEICDYINLNNYHLSWDDK